MRAPQSLRVCVKRCQSHIWVKITNGYAGDHHFSAITPLSREWSVESTAGFQKEQTEDTSNMMAGSVGVGTFKPNRKLLVNTCRARCVDIRLEVGTISLLSTVCFPFERSFVLSNINELRVAKELETASQRRTRHELLLVFHCNSCSEKAPSSHQLIYSSSISLQIF